MANLIVKRGEAAPIAREWDPFRMMRELGQWDPLQEMSGIFPYPIQEAMSFTPAFEVKETKDGYIFKADVPGIHEKDLEIAVTGNRLAISGHRETEQRDKSDTWYAYERAYGSFSRSFTLPEGVDTEHVKAELKEGVLTLQLSKLPEAQTRRITFQVQKGKA